MTLWISFSDHYDLPLLCCLCCVHKITKMKGTRAFAFLLLTLLSISVDFANACDCFPTSVEDSLYGDRSDTVFRGYVQRQQMTNDTDPFPNKYYVVSVGRIFKGCTFTNATTILVETAADSGICGVSLDLKKNYLFSGNTIPSNPEIVKITSRRSPNIIKTVMVRIHLCAINTEFKYLRHEDRATLWNSTNVCTKCASAADCGGIDKFYCDQGKCVAYDRPCPPIKMLPWLVNDNMHCMDDPCLTNKPCIDNAKCIQNKCDKCGWPLWIDPNGTRVCNN